MGESLPQKTCDTATSLLFIKYSELLYQMPIHGVFSEWETFEDPKIDRDIKCDVQISPGEFRMYVENVFDRLPALQNEKDFFEFRSKLLPLIVHQEFGKETKAFLRLEQRCLILLSELITLPALATSENQITKFIDKTKLILIDYADAQDGFYRDYQNKLEEEAKLKKAKEEMFFFDTPESDSESNKSQQEEEEEEEDIIEINNEEMKGTKMVTFQSQSPQRNSMMMSLRSNSLKFDDSISNQFLSRSMNHSLSQKKLTLNTIPKAKVPHMNTMSQSDSTPFSSKKSITLDDETLKNYTQPKPRPNAIETFRKSQEMQKLQKAKSRVYVSQRPATQIINTSKSGQVVAFKPLMTRPKTSIAQILSFDITTSCPQDIYRYMKRIINQYPNGICEVKMYQKFQGAFEIWKKEARPTTGISLIKTFNTTCVSINSLFKFPINKSTLKKINDLIEIAQNATQPQI